MDFINTNFVEKYNFEHINEYKHHNQVLFDLIVFIFLFQNINAVKSSFLDNQNKKTLLGKIQQGSPTETTCNLVCSKTIMIINYYRMYLIVISLIFKKFWLRIFPEQQLFFLAKKYFILGKFLFYLMVAPCLLANFEYPCNIYVS